MNYINNKESNFFAIVVIGMLFFIFGFITWLNGTLIPFLKISCELNNFQAYFVTFSFYISYFFMALPSSWILYKVGFKNGISLGLGIMSIGSLLFIPAAIFRSYGIFLTGLFIQGTGLAILQTAVNPYVTILGPIESAARRISIMGLCNKIAGIISPLILGAIVLKGISNITEQLDIVLDNEKLILLNNLSKKIIPSYVIMGIVLVILAIVFFFIHLPEVDNSSDKKDKEKKDYIWKYPQLVLGFVAIFLYVGVEVISADTIVLFGQYEGIQIEKARVFTSFTLFFMLVGYLIGIILIPKYLKQEKALFFSALLGILLSFIILLTKGYASIITLATLGIANAVMWPAIWPIALKGLGHLTKLGSSILIMGILGGAIIPLIYGKLADLLGNKIAYFVLIPCYLFIAFYAQYGTKITSNNQN